MTATSIRASRQGFVNRAVETGDVVAKVGPAKLVSDPFTTAVAFIRDASSRVEDLYRLEHDGGFDLMKPVRADAKAFTVDRIAGGAALLRDIWWSAWRTSAQPRRRSSIPPE